MSSEWRECTLGELVNIKHGFAFSGEHISKNQGKRVLVTPGNFEIGGGFKEGNAKYFHGPYPEEYVFAPSDDRPEQNRRYTWLFCKNTSGGKQDLSP
jgi:type I restriction enzyme S subunit